MECYKTVVIGGGAAGICAAINLARAGESVVICEKLSQLGKKILATGNGRCNLLNEKLDESHYNSAAEPLVKSIFRQYGKKEILKFFHGLGLETYSQDDRMFPVTNQASSVLKVLEIEIQRLKIPVECGFVCSGVSFEGNNIVISAKDGRQLSCQNVVLTGGGKSYPVLGSDGSILDIAHQLGHSIVEPVPAAVPLVIKDQLCHLLQGQRIQASAQAVIDEKKLRAIQGELLFTKYGLSGTCILDISEEISVALNRTHKKNVFIAADLVPFMDKDKLKTELQHRTTNHYSHADMLVGILPNKFSIALKDLFENGTLETAVNALKDYRFRVTETKDWDEAEFTSGGISLSEINQLTLESKLHKNLYFAGEVLDVNGKRGGYNLAWAWASGLVAGETR